MDGLIRKLALLWLLTGLLLSACASNIPRMIREAPADNPPVETVRDHIDDYRGREVRWGGKLIETGNREKTTLLTVLSRPLYKDGEPRLDDDSGGRFIAIVPAFLDPKIYAADRLVTVTGTLLRAETHKVGEYPYRYPVVEAKAWYLWPRESVAPYGYPYPGWYDPWYGPWYGPYGPWYYNPWRPYGYPY
jgi:outer membrane lipoprotein